MAQLSLYSHDKIISRVFLNSCAVYVSHSVQPRKWPCAALGPTLEDLVQPAQNLHNWTLGYFTHYIIVIFSKGPFPTQRLIIPKGCPQKCEKYECVNNVCVNFFPSLGKIRAKLYAVLARKRVMLRFYAFV